MQSDAWDQSAHLGFVCVSPTGGGQEMAFILEYLTAYAKRAFRLLADFLVDNLQNSVDREIKPKL